MAPRRKAYMVVGAKTVCGGAVSVVERGTRSGQELEASAGDGLLLPAGAGCAVGAGMHRSSEKSTTYGATLEGDRVFAVEYRIVSRKLLARYREGPGIKLGGVKTVDWGQGTMGSDDESDEDYDDDDNEDLDEEEEEEDGCDVLPLLTKVAQKDVMFLS
ncbi:hypothetical protein MN608_11152 [Microdochium nivale]|nr:hypothetical protein MN608_11152 [Microdochium nivale]